MAPKSLDEISTQWSQMEDLLESEGPAALSEFLAVRYFEALALKFKQYRNDIDDLKAHELASEVVYGLIKNDYRGVKRLDRNRGHLRGLFTTTVKKVIIDKIYRKKSEEALVEDFELSEKQLDQWVDLYIDFQDSIEKLKTKRPLLHQPFVEHYLEGKAIKEIGDSFQLTQTAVKQRLLSARRWLAETLSEKN